MSSYVGQSSDVGQSVADYFRFLLGPPSICVSGPQKVGQTIRYVRLLEKKTPQDCENALKSQFSTFFLVTSMIMGYGISHGVGDGFLSWVFSHF